MLSQYYLLDSSECLVSSLSEDLDSIVQTSLDATGIVFPTQRLASYFLGELARKKGACFPPIVSTLEQLVLQEASKSIKLKPANDNLVEYLFLKRLKDASFQHLRVGHERELRLILQELHENQLRDQGLKSLKTYLKEDIYRDIDHLGSLEQRAQEIEAILEYVEESLYMQGLCIRQDYMAQAMSLAAKKWQDKLPLELNQLIFTAYTSVSPSWRPLLESLIKNPAVSFYMAKAPASETSHFPLEELNQMISKHRLATLKSASPRSKIARKSKVLETSNTYLECRAVIAATLELINKTQDPARIGIVVTSEAKYRSYLRTLVQEAALSVNMALSFPIESTPIGRWLKHTMQLCSKGFDRHELYAWMHCETSENWLENMGRKTKYFKFELSEVFYQAANISSWKELIDSCDKSEWKKTFTLIRERISSLSQDNTSNKWLEHWKLLLDEFQVQKFCSKTHLESFQQQLFNFEELLGQLTNKQEALLDVDEFWHLVNKQLLDADIRNIGEPLKGVQIISLAESRFFPFDVVFLLGCNEGCFPKALPKDLLIDDYLKQKMGLAGWPQLEAMEDQSFHLLHARTPQLIMTRPSFQDESIQVRSRFIEKLMTQTAVEIIKLDDSVALLTRSLFQKEDKNIDEAYSPQLINHSEKIALEGKIILSVNELSPNISASSLSKLISCPYQFLLNKLKIEDKQIPIQEKDPKSEGEWLHGVMEAFFTGSFQGKAYCKPLNEDINAFDKKKCLDRLIELSCKLGPNNIEKSALFFQLKDTSWPAFVNHLETYYENNWDQLKESVHEFDFSQQSEKLTWNVSYVDFQLVGRIDTIWKTKKINIVIDYKRSYSPPKKDVELGLSPQLALYAKVISQLDQYELSKTIFGYWEILKGKWILIAAGADALDYLRENKFIKQQSNIIEIDKLIKNTETIWKWRKDLIREKKRFFADPSECRLCKYSGICRKQDESDKYRLEKQKYLEKKLKQNEENR